MSLFFHIATALGLALAAAIRPFAPAPGAGAPARSHVLRATSHALLRWTGVRVVSAWQFATFAILRRRDPGRWAAGAALGLGGLRVSR
jgi:hypothetical protein